MQCTCTTKQTVVFEYTRISLILALPFLCPSTFSKNYTDLFYWFQISVGIYEDTLKAGTLELQLFSVILVKYRKYYHIYALFIAICSCTKLCASVRTVDSLSAPQLPGYLASVSRWSRCGYSQTEVVEEVVSGRSRSTSLYVYQCTFIVYSSTCSTGAL